MSMLQHVANKQRDRYVVRPAIGGWRIADRLNRLTPVGELWFKTKSSAQSAADMLNGRAP